MNTLPVEPLWLTAEQVVEINRREVEETGEPHFLIHADLLESALARAKNAWIYQGQEDMAVLAVKTLAGIAWNHAFQQGNKRTACTAALVFLRLNGYQYPNTITKELGYWIEAIITKTVTEEEIADYIAEQVISTDD